MVFLVLLNKEMLKLAIKTKVISISIAVFMLLSVAALSVTAVNAAEANETTVADTTAAVTNTTDAVSSTVDSATVDSTNDSANGSIATGEPALWAAGFFALIAAAGSAFVVANRSKENI